MDKIHTCSMIKWRILSPKGSWALYFLFSPLIFYSVPYFLFSPLVVLVGSGSKRTEYKIRGLDKK